MHSSSERVGELSQGTSIGKAFNTDTMPYTNCQTQIIDLGPLKLPKDTHTPDTTFRQIYRDYMASHDSHIAQNRSNGSSSRSETAMHQATGDRHAENLAAAVLSLTCGVAPPVAFPTETVYGLGADATNPASIAGIFAAKGRPSDNPLIVHVSSREQLERFLGGTTTESAIPKIYQDLVQEFWPGPLTILIPVPKEGKGVKFAPNVHPGQGTIGFRVPSSPHARFLMAVTDRPIAAPSANSSGKPSPTTAQHVKDDLDGKINFILDGGNCHVGVESTVVDGLGEKPLILRPGGVSKSALRSWGKKRGNAWASVENGWEVKKMKKTNDLKRKRVKEQQHTNGELHHKTQKLSNGVNGHTEGGDGSEELESTTAAPRAPGMKYKHYAPKGRMVLFETPHRLTTAAGANLGLAAAHAKTRELLLPDGDDGDGRPTRSLTIGILTSTTWPRHMSIDAAIQQGRFPGWHLHEQQQQHEPSTKSTSSTSIDITVTVTTRPTPTRLRIHTIALGTTSSSISRTLFAALRTCDDLGCDVIFAEAPAVAEEEEQEEREDFETVLERMRKAATEVVLL